MPQEQFKESRSFIFRHYILVSIVLIIVILFGGYFFLVSPQYQKWQKGKQEVNNLGQGLEQKQKELTALENLEKEYNGINQEEIKKIDQFLPSEKDLPNLYIQLEAIAQESGLILSSIDTNIIEKSSEDTPSNLGVIEVKLRLEGGNYGLLKKFLDETENNLRIFDIVSLSFPEKVDSFDIILKTYYLK